MNKTILYVANVDWFFHSHRSALAKEAVTRGYKVYVITKDTGYRSRIENMGVTFIDINFERAGKNPLKDFGLIIKLLLLYKRFKPDIIHHIAHKPNLYGAIAYRYSGLGHRTRVVNAVSGLGAVFTGENQSLTQRLLFLLMRLAYGSKKVNIIFQNPDDQKLFADKGFLSMSNYTLIKGAGVDIKQYPFTPKKMDEKIVVMLPARMLVDKGIREFITAAEFLRTKLFGKVCFRLVGGADALSLTSLSEQELKSYEVPDYIEWVGHKENMRPELEMADIVCLPSYREGLPKALIEAMAIGRPIITTDVPGCRECVDDSINGLLVPAKNPEALADAILTLVNDEILCLRMGLKSREKMLAEMTLDKVIQQTFDFYQH